MYTKIKRTIFKKGFFLTRGLVPIGAKSDVVLLIALTGSCYFRHFLDFRHAEFGVVVEEHAATLNGEVVLGPIPKLAQVLVVQGVEGVETEKGKKLEHNFRYASFFNSNQIT